MGCWLSDGNCDTLRATGSQIGCGWGEEKCGKEKI